MEERGEANCAGDRVETRRFIWDKKTVRINKRDLVEIHMTSLAAGQRQQKQASKQAATLMKRDGFVCFEIGFPSLLSLLAYRSPISLLRLSLSVFLRFLHHHHSRLCSGSHAGQRDLALTLSKVSPALDESPKKMVFSFFFIGKCSKLLADSILIGPALNIPKLKF